MPDLTMHTVVFHTHYKKQVDQIVDLSKQFEPAFRIEHHFTCNSCKTEVYSTEYLKDCPNCGNFLWNNAEYKSC